MNRFALMAGLVLVLSACAEKPAEVSTSHDDALALITQEKMLAHLEYLSSDELEGREHRPLLNPLPAQFPRPESVIAQPPARKKNATPGPKGYQNYKYGAFPLDFAP
jgi:hypothetical protein